MRPELLVLCYHGLSESWPDETAVRPQRLTEQIEALLRRGYRGTTFSDALTAPRFPNTLVVTFDDAAASVYEHAAPRLAELGVPGTVFVPTDLPNAPDSYAWSGLEGWLGGEHEHELRGMTWEQLRALAGAGWEIGSHTCSHPHLTSVPDAELHRELTESKSECERQLGIACVSLAYPYGDVDSRVARAARSAGYLCGAATSETPTVPLPMLWPRVVVYRRDTARRVWLRARSPALGLAPLVGPVLSAGRRTGRAVRRAVERPSAA